MTSTISCGGKFVLQGPSSGTISKNFTNLPSHSYLSLFFSIYVIGDWSTTEKITVSGFSISGPMTQVTNNSYCTELTSKFGIAEAVIQFAHTSTYFVFEIKSSFSVGRGYAIRDVAISPMGSLHNRQCFYIEPSLTYISSNPTLCYSPPPNNNYIAHRDQAGTVCASPCLSCNSNGCMRCLPGAYLIASTFISGGQTSQQGCQSCSTNCTMCLNSTMCLACNTNSYHLQSNTCTGTCGLLVKANIVGGLDCYTPCIAPYALLNQQCVYPCPVGFATNYVNNANVCKQICNSTAYYYNGTCYSQCIPPLFPRIDNSTLLQLCYNVSCPAGSKLLPDATCNVTCPNGTTLNNSNPDFVVCSGLCPVFYYYQNGSCIPMCDAPFFPYIDPISHNQLCVLCNNTDGYLPDETCISVCPNKTNNITINNNIYCQGPCPISQFYFNYTCLPSCFPPYHAFTDNISHIPSCVICEEPNYLTLPDYTCASTCPQGLNHTIKDGLDYCLGTCYNVDQYLYKNGTCLDDCPNPFTPYIDPITHELKCKLCDGTDGILPNMTCTHVCPVASTVNVSYFGDFYCNAKCPVSQFFVL